ncbi:MAG: cytochrome C oxidase subunit IV family protein [Candidatus Solibacter usitatus]|nr:cytochrome C oxidase subunit IV family protein [Candidatus Solibacter usitatus]
MDVYFSYGLSDVGEEMKNATGIWALLLGLTLAEVALAYPSLAPAVFLLVLLALSVGKSALIIAFFMHLRFASRALTLALFPILIALILLLLGFLPDAQRVMHAA